MTDTLASLQRKMKGAGELETVVHSMKTIAASNINQYERATASLSDYYLTVRLGLKVAMGQTDQFNNVQRKPIFSKQKPLVHVVIFGSDQGLVGQFNDRLAEFAKSSLLPLSGQKMIWSVGERIRERFDDPSFVHKGLFAVPSSLAGIARLVTQVLLECASQGSGKEAQPLFIFHNSPKPAASYEPVFQRLLPLDSKWLDEFSQISWPSRNLPELFGDREQTLRALIREYLFVSIFKACAGSMTSENASRLAAMQRAERNITELLEELDRNYHQLRQSAIDEELFDIISGFEALKT